MSSFTRYAAVAFVVLSLGFLVASAPVTSYATIPAITGDDAVSLVIAELVLGLEAKFHALLACKTETELKVLITAIVSVFQNCASELLKIGAGVAVGVDAQASIVASIVATITLLVQVCTRLVVKFGLDAIVTVCAGLDVAIHACLVNLGICIEEIVVLIAKGMASATVNAFANIGLNLCLGILGVQL